MIAGNFLFFIFKKGELGTKHRPVRLNKWAGSDLNMFEVGRIQARLGPSLDMPKLGITGPMNTPSHEVSQPQERIFQITSFVPSFHYKLQKSICFFKDLSI